MIKLALRDVWAHFTRFILTILSVVLGVAFLSGTLALRVDLEETFVQSFTSTTSGTLQVQGKPLSENSKSRATVPVDLADEIKQVDGVQDARAEIGVPITILDKDDHPITGIGVATILMNNMDGFTPWTYSNKVPSNEGQIAFEAAALERYGFKVGDTIEYLAKGKRHEAEIVSSIKLTTDVAIVNVTSTDWDTVIDLYDDPTRTSTIAVQTKGGDELQPIMDRISAKIGSDYDVRTSKEVIDESADAIQDVLGFVTTFLLVFIILALGVSTFIIGNTFNMAVKARQKEFAYLRAVGASPAQIFFQVAVQAIVIGLVGSALGLGLGVGLLALASWALMKFGITSDVTTALPTDVMIVSMIVGVVVTFVGAILPARTAAQTPPVEAMREVSGVREKPLWPRAIIGLIFIIAGAAAMYVGAQKEIEYAGTTLGVGAGAVVIGVLIASPAMVKFLIGIIAWPLRRMNAMVSKVAAGNTVRNPRRTAATAGALIIGMGLVTLGTILASSVQKSTADAIESQMHADFMVGSVTPGEVISDETLEALENVNGVKDVNGEYRQTAGMTTLNDEPFYIPFSILDTNTLGRDFDVPLVDGSLSTLNDGEVVLSEPMSEQLGKTTGDTITITGNEGPKDVKIGGIHEAMLISPSSIMTKQTQEDLGLEQTGRPLVTMFLADGQNLDVVKERIQDAVSDNPTLAVYDKSDMRAKTASVINTVLAILYALLALSIAVAVLGIVNTLGLAVSERTTEIALMRAIGTSRLQMAGTITIEAILTSIYGTVIGMVTGLGVSVALVKYTADVGVKILSIPWGTLGWMLLAAIVVGAIASIGPALRAARQPILDAIVSE